MKLSTLATVACLALTSKADAFADAYAFAFAEGDAVPWADAVPEANAVAQAYAEAYAEALAIAHPDPQAYALAASEDDCATFSCHAACGYLILDAQACSINETDTYSGPYNTTCLCSDGSNFLERYPSCMECGWTLWKYYGVYVTEALAACSTLSTEPTGTLRCSTTLTDSYTKDANAGCAYGGGCTSTESDGSSASGSASVSESASTTDDSSASGSASASGSGSASASASASSASAAGAAVSGEASGSASGSASASASASESESSSTSASSTANSAQILAAGSSLFGIFALALFI
ncbi:uncharacterized protein CYBJADRAFT_185797 [Cyberlindnera jadinii NRRL Y-1542]|uniref:Uncharacterized protein n=1 Tax=Cyberlindnera jadinii (strain ATCC 18201 / CBS 1600 / BCRC 20928 / JCM 3617 / NBRC 0987 / NRRL Y-1542) TaxID=983966 RepID=A0A1E4RYR0_CYBJN|nr:hypothetical protein CYBJADRAFT_185797 [Cyberlindnera jadinii NRRL Y-1542]ODV72321.1 hypothetical protein CYBJADRAFT_185797 [Cyberlindnera jadinii NRRL Y-1542]